MATIRTAKILSAVAALGLAGTTAAQVIEIAGEAAEQQPKQERAFALMVGDPAPPLAIGKWVKGDPVESLAGGKVTVVEFWATWCGPCIGGMPHLTEVQKDYADRGVRVVGVNIWDEPAKVGPFMKEPVPIHEVPGDKVMGYTVAIEEKDDPDDVRNGVMAKTWMKAAGQNGIPTAFIVDGEGRIAWIGHPMRMDDPLEKVVGGEWDLAAESKAYADRMAAAGRIDKYFALFGKGEYTAAYALGHELVAGPMAADAGRLNELAWGMVDPARRPSMQDLDLALKAAQRANELTGDKDPAILDTLAAVYFDRGELEMALKYQRSAVEHAADTPLAEELEQRLKSYEAEAKKRAGPGQ